LFRAVGIVGVGLLGGSLALALKQRGLAKEVVGITPIDFPAGSAVLDAALKLHAIDRKVVGFDDRLHELDALVVSTPVELIADQVIAATSFLSKNALITDVGGAKTGVVDRLSEERRFIGSHPMAGSERSGVESASAQLFAGRTCIITPTENTPTDLIHRATRFWEALGMTVLRLSPEEHDEVVGRTSHLPHVAASALAALLDESDRAFVGPGLKDTTRIAAGNPALWTGILSANKAAVLAALQRLRAEFDAVASALESDDSLFLQQWLTNAKRVRDALGS
jgi:prephenate dehydrogenase